MIDLASETVRFLGNSSGEKLFKYRIINESIKINLGRFGITLTKTDEVYQLQFLKNLVPQGGGIFLLLCPIMTRVNHNKGTNVNFFRLFYEHGNSE